MGNPFRKIAGASGTAVKESSMSKEAGKLIDQDGQFNPQRFDRTESGESNRRMFDSKGQINAQDKKEALTQAYHLLNKVVGRTAGKISDHPAYDSGLLNKEAHKRVLQAAVNDPRGFHLVGEELALPIKAILDYEGFARKLFMKKSLAQGEIFRIQKDIRSVAYIIGQDGQTPEARPKGKFVQGTEVKISSFPEIDLLDQLQSLYDLVDRAQDTARQEIELQEDKYSIDLLDAAAQTTNTVTGFSSLDIDALETVRYQVERHRLMADKFLINRAEVSDVIKNLSTLVDPVTERELILAGYVGTLLGASIMTVAGVADQEVIPAGTFYCVGAPDLLGVLGERQAVKSEGFDKYSLKETVKGWAFVEVIGLIVANDRAVAKGLK
jgi:hypothetical protein